MIELLVNIDRPAGVILSVAAAAIIVGLPVLFLIVLASDGGQR